MEDYCVEEVGYATQGEEVCEGQVRENVFVDFGGEDSHCYVPRGPSRFRPGERSEGGFGFVSERGGNAIVVGFWMTVRKIRRHFIRANHWDTPLRADDPIITISETNLIHRSCGIAAVSTFKAYQG